MTTTATYSTLVELLNYSLTNMKKILLEKIFFLYSIVSAKDSTILSF